MTQLKALGGLRLDASPFTQPKPLLFLCYLAVEGPKPKRHLAELFWQDGNRMKSLSMTVTRLRQGAGDVIGTDEVRCWSASKSDVRDLLEALEESDWQRASELYTGAFLEGVALDDWSNELEEWVYVTREYLAQRVQHALLNLAETAARKQDFRLATTFAIRAYQLPGLGGNEVATLNRLYPLLCAGNSLLAPEVRKEAAGYGITLQLTSQQARATFGPQRVITTLPMRGTSFVGRDIELTELATLLGKPNVSLLTLLGPGGVGKTRLALQLAYEQLKSGTFEDKVYFVALDALNDARLIPKAILKQLGLSQQANADHAEQLVDFIAERRLLLVLDNFEHLQEGTVFLSPLLTQCPNLKLLVTSRERLKLEEEHTFTVEGLPYPQTPYDEATLSDAVQLFNERAQRMHPHFDLGQELSGVISICQLVEGSPLGIELAASWVKLMSCAEIANEVRANLEFLLSAHSNIPERHRSLKAAFESSWRLLSFKEQETLRRLSVFRGGFRREAASTVVGATIPVLASLVDKSLLRVSPNGRFDRHALLYQFTQEKLADHPEELTRMQVIHAQFFLGLAEEAEPQLQRKEQGHWFRRLSEELDNFREAFKSLDSGGDTETALRLATSLGYFWSVQGYYTEGYGYLTKLLSQASSHNLTKAKGLFLAGVLACAQSDHESAHSYLKQSLAVAKSLGVASLEARSLRMLGHIAHHNQSDPERARSLYTSALKLARKSDDRTTVAEVLRSLGNLNLDQANHHEARIYLEESADLSEQLGDDHGCAKAFSSLATVLTSLGERDQAHVLNKQSLELFRAVGDKYGEGIALLNLGMDASQRGDMEAELEFYQASLGVFKKLGNKHMVSHLLNNLGASLQNQGNVREAYALLKESLTIQRTVGDVFLKSHALHMLGKVLDDQGKHEEAYRCYQECLSLCRKANDKWSLMRVLVSLANWHIDQQDYPTAWVMLIEAAEISQISGDQRALSKTFETQAKLECVTSNPARAVRLLAFVEKIREQLGFARAPRDQQAFDKLVTHLHSQLEGAHFKNVWSHGQGLTPDQAFLMCRDFPEQPYIEPEL